MGHVWFSSRRRSNFYKRRTPLPELWLHGQAFLLSCLSLAVDVPEMLRARHVENGIARGISTLVG